MSNHDNGIEVEEYKQQANALKEKGNEAFQGGDIDLAIRFFSQALDIDPDNHIIYSNRSAAYMKADSKSKALYDAEKCVQLAPQWAKGYTRLGAAQQSLRRFDAAIDSFKKGIELEPSNKSLWNSLKSCQDAYEIDKKQRFLAAQKEREHEEERNKRRDEMKAAIMKEKLEAEADDILSSFLSDVQGSSQGVCDSNHVTQLEKEDDVLADFFSEVASTKPTEKRQVVQVDVDAINMEEDEDERILTEKYVKQDLGDGRRQCDRLISKHHEWKNLNPYYVLELDTDATIADIKFRYKKLSLKVHPDRLRDIPHARQAFEYVKEAYNKLLDEDQRRTTIMHIDNVTTDLKRERKRLLAKGINENELPDYAEDRNKLLMKHFADLEQMRRLSDKNRRSYSAREQMQEKELEEKMAKFNEFDKDWSEENRREKRVGSWRDFQNDPTAKKTKASNFKEETRHETKHGVVKLEEWKKKWK